MNNRLYYGVFLFAHSLFRDAAAALIVFDVRERKTFERAVSDHTLPDGRLRKSWFKIVNHKCGDIPPVKLLGKLQRSYAGDTSLSYKINVY